MSAKSCTACNDLREYAPEFVLNGTTDNVAEHLKQDEGLSGAEQHTDCEDLLDVNDCLVGNMLDELDAYDVCNWKDFMAAFIGNMYETIKAMVYSQCGQWCAINSMYEGLTLSIGESTTGDAYAVAGKGVSFLLPHAGQERTNDLALVYVAGGLLHGSGSFQLFNSNFTDAQACSNFDNGATVTQSSSRLGNSVWGKTNGQTGFPVNGGELLCEFRIKKSAYPQIRTLFTGFGREANFGSFGVRAISFYSGNYAYGQHGPCNADGSSAGGDYSVGHLVPDGWWYIQLRITSCHYLPMTEGAQISPIYFMGIRMNPDEISC